MRISLVLAVALLTGIGTISSAQAATRSARCTSANTSVYGTIKSVEGRAFSMNATDDLYGRYIRTTREDGSLLVRASGARINYDGLAIRPGVFAGVYGCFAGRENFDASRITLATSLQTYPGRHGRLVRDRDDQSMSRARQTITGTVVTNGPGTRVLISTADGRQIAVFTSELRRARVGDRVMATGYINSKGSFQASSARDLTHR